jgi:hypothetical protein
MAQLERPTAATADGPPEAIPIGKAQVQDRVVVTGVVTSATPMALSGFPACRYTLADESGEIDLMFLGRVRVAGLEPGRHLSAEGRVTQRDGRTVIWNPRYLLDTG